MKFRQESGYSVFQIIIIAFTTVIGIMFFMPYIDNKPQKNRVEEIYDDPMFFCEVSVKEKLKDPDSYKKTQMLIPEKISSNEKILRWDFRSKNGFGGYSLSTAECFVSKEGRGIIKTRIKSLD